MNIDELVSKIVDGVTKSLKESLKESLSEEWVKEAVVSNLKEKSGEIEGFVTDQPVAETPVDEVPVVTEAQEATTGGLVSTTGGLVDDLPKKVKAHLVNPREQRNIGIPSEVAKKLKNNIPKDKLNINKTSEESNITVVPPEPPQVEEVDEPVIQSLPDVDVTNEQNVNNQSVENTVNNDVSSLSDVDVATTAADMADKSIGESEEKQAESLVNTGRTFVKTAVTDNEADSSMPHLSGSFGN